MMIKDKVQKTTEYIILQKTPNIKKFFHGKYSENVERNPAQSVACFYDLIYSSCESVFEVLELKDFCETKFFTKK
ncbi:Hypothetical protein SRAE_2000254100 [Strongyloides ratti]|uniref:Uncharacterized protein n=1 Tax=Strongyloides ratti TaxID=34506 RepID=A0A090MYW2_STRRB|nr:Hypothetical protein SRAE_2000254100 [Strongyloides ratti]CEF67879.1 Hypothetical protein SRAE_2000254100 [Strongyloides ratti]